MDNLIIFMANSAHNADFVSAALLRFFLSGIATVGVRGAGGPAGSTFGFAIGSISAQNFDTVLERVRMTMIVLTALYGGDYKIIHRGVELPRTPAV
jgi:hypothetical protein